jgi:hypothetical protein
MFRPLVMLDTLTSYVAQSWALGWITTQPLAAKYSDYFHQTRFQLQNANVEGAVSTLQTVLVQAHLDSSSALTNEAYALIRFNTAYLIENLKSLNTGKQ